jgi:hypothetical protein
MVLASTVLAHVSPKRIWVETSYGVNGSSGILALECVDLGW